MGKAILHTMKWANPAYLNSRFILLNRRLLKHKYAFLQQKEGVNQRELLKQTHILIRFFIRKMLSRTDQADMRISLCPGDVQFLGDTHCSLSAIYENIDRKWLVTASVKAAANCTSKQLKNQRSSSALLESQILSYWCL